MGRIFIFPFFFFFFCLAIKHSCQFLSHFSQILVPQTRILRKCQNFWAQEPKIDPKMQLRRVIFESLEFLRPLFSEVTISSLAPQFENRGRTYLPKQKLSAHPHPPGWVRSFVIVKKWMKTKNDACLSFENKKPA